MKNLILWFRAVFGDSRLYEFEAVANAQLGWTKKWTWDTEIHTLDGGDIGPNLIQPLPESYHSVVHTLANVAQKTMACKGVFSILSHGKDAEQCLSNLGEETIEEMASIIDASWCFRFAQLGKKERYKTEMRKNIVEQFGDSIPILHHHPVDLKNPTHEFYYLEDYRREHGVPALDGNTNPHQVWLLYRHPPQPDIPHIRSLESTLSLSRRAFISSTSLEESRSIQLVNMALNGEGKGKSILDPFCGSGSILLTASVFGARCVGADKRKYLLLPHKRVLHIPPSKLRKQRGKEKVSIYDNFSELRLPNPTLLHSINIFQEDALSLYLEANQNKQYDAIITDPPYGIRASRIESETDIVQRLLALSYQLLRVGGKLVFLFPTSERNQYPLLNNNPFLHLVSIGWERFSNDTYRMIVVMKKEHAH